MQIHDEICCLEDAGITEILHPERKAMVTAGWNRKRELFHCPCRKSKKRTFLTFVFSSSWSHLSSQTQMASVSFVATSTPRYSCEKGHWPRQSRRIHQTALLYLTFPRLHLLHGPAGKQPPEKTNRFIFLGASSSKSTSSWNYCMEHWKPLFLASYASNFWLQALSEHDQHYWYNLLRKSLKKIQPLPYDEGRCLDLRTQALLEREKIKGSLTVLTYQKQTNEPPVHRMTLLIISEPGWPFVLRTLNNKSKNKQKESFPTAESKFWNEII